jgi:RNA polymerase sigma-70 factor (family 1)
MFLTQISDHELWASIRLDDEVAFNILFKRYWIPLYKTAYQYLKDKESSEEVVHDVFLNIWGRRSELYILTFSSYMLSAIRYQIYNRMRAARLPLIYGDDHISSKNFSDYNLGENRIQEEELQQEIQAFLQQLPKRCQEIFCMSRIEQLSNQEIALRLGISKRTVENQITAALKHLRHSLKHLAPIKVAVS